MCCSYSKVRYKGTGAVNPAAQCTEKRDIEISHEKYKRSANRYACINMTTGVTVTGHTPTADEIFNITELCNEIPFCFDNRCLGNCPESNNNEDNIGSGEFDIACVLDEQVHITPTTVIMTTYLSTVQHTTICLRNGTTVSMSTISTSQAYSSSKITTTPTLTPTPTPTPSPTPIPSNLECPILDFDCLMCVGEGCEGDVCIPYKAYCEGDKRRKRDIPTENISCFVDTLTTTSPTIITSYVTPSPSSQSLYSSQYLSSSLTSNIAMQTNTVPSCEPASVAPGRFLYDEELVNCEPANDNFNPCVDLIDSTILRVAIWAVIILSIGGNVLVITVTAGHFILRYIKQRRKPALMYYLYVNLAVADLLMGIYLLTIAIADLATIGEYSEHAIYWQTGHGCRFAGFCAIMSSLLSVYTLLVITLERVYTIKFAVQQKLVKKRYAAIFVIIGWIVIFILSILPMIGVSSYGRVSICLPFDTRRPVDTGYVAFLLIITGIATFIIFLSYVVLFYMVACSKNKRGLHRSMTGRDELKLAARMSILVITDFACWAPIAFFGLTAAFNLPLIGVQEAKVLMVFIFPINSCLNPILYSFSTRKFRSIFVSLFNKMCKRSTYYRHQSTTAFTSDLKKSNDIVIMNGGVGRTERRGTELSILSRFMSQSSAADSQQGSRRGSAFSTNSIEETTQNNNKLFTQIKSERDSQSSIGSEDSVEFKDRRISLASLSGHVNQLTALPEENEDAIIEAVNHVNSHEANCCVIEIKENPLALEENEETSFNDKGDDDDDDDDEPNEGYCNPLFADSVTSITISYDDAEGTECQQQNIVF